MTTVQIVVVTCASLGFLVLILELIRRRLLREKYAMAWLLVSLLICTTPWLFDYYVLLANALGFVDSTNFFLSVAAALLLLLILQCTLALSSAFRQRRSLAQRLALLEERQQRLEQELADRQEASKPAGAGHSDQSDR